MGELWIFVIGWAVFLAGAVAGWVVAAMCGAAAAEDRRLGRERRHDG